jgi:hypothetical protein
VPLGRAAHRTPQNESSLNGSRQHHDCAGESSTADLATKIVVAIVRDEGREPDPLERLLSEDTDVGTNPAVGEKVLAFLKEHAAKSAIVTDGLIGCPHEEGIDYSEGKSCPLCPYWAGRDRFTRERIQ